MILVGNSLDLPLADESIHCCVTSPPYWGLRSYNPDAMRLKNDAPQWVVDELERLGVFPRDHTGE